MNPHPPLSLTPRELLRTLNEHRKLWIAPAVVCGLLAAAYSLVMPRYWEATQALVVRQETAGSQNLTPGKFNDLYEMRTLQETILELAKSREVVVATLKAVDQRMLGAAKEPDDEAVEEFRKRLKMLPPDGGEFGKSEVFYFSLKDPNRARAIELVSELCLQLEAGLKWLRAARAESLVSELEEQVALANETQQQETKRLAEFETEVGADLGELRMLHSASSGQSDLRQEAVQLEADGRKFETQVRESEQLLEMLRAAEKDPQQLIAMPNSLLASQPALRRLKDGLVDAQLATAKLGGTRSSDHPRVQAAVEGEKRIRADLHGELVAAIRGAEAEVRIGQARVTESHRRLAEVEQRLNRLAERRAEYSNRVAALENSRITLDRVRQNLSTAKAAEAAARSGSLVTRIDHPETGPYPVGPGRTVIAGAGAIGGLMLGLGLVFLTATPGGHDPSHGAVQHTTAPTSLVGKRPVVDEAPHTPWEPNALRERERQQAAPPEPLHTELTPTQQRVASPLPPAPALPNPVVTSAPLPPVTAAATQLETAMDNTAPLQNPWTTRPAWANFAEPAEEPVYTGAASWADSSMTGDPTTNIDAAASGMIHQLNQWSTDEPASEPSVAVAVAVAEPPARRAVLPSAVGTLPSAVGTLPAASAPALGGMSLQEALQAARQAQL